MHPLRHIEDDPHDAPIAPDIVPADWNRSGPSNAISREKLFAEIRQAAETAAPKVDNTFRATDVNDIPALKDRSRSRTWMKRAATVFVFALVSAFATAAWKHHGDAATEAVANWVPLPGVNASPAAEPSAEADQAAAAQQAAAPPAETASGAAPFPPEAEQQIQSLTRDLAAMSQEVEQLKATIETLKASQQAAAPPPPVVRAPAPPPKPKVTAVPPRPAPVPAPHATRATYPPAMQAAAVPPPAAAPPAYQPPPQPYSAPPQATTQPNGEPILRPPMPMPLQDRY